jgi:uncharacterized protein YkwD
LKDLKAKTFLRQFLHYLKKRIIVKKFNQSNVLLALAVSSAFVLSACGGGGGSSSDSGTTPTTPTLAASSIVGTVSPANCAAGIKKSASDYLNAQRQGCEFGLLQQNAAIDTAAQAHTSYLDTNNLAQTHFEDFAAYPTGFTGNTVADRIAAAGYAGVTSTEVGSTSVAAYGFDLGQAGVMDLFTAPYHGAGMLASFRDTGVGYVHNGASAVPDRLFMDFGTSAASPAQLLSSTQVATYPCAGTTGILSKSYGSESPTPIVGRDIGTTPIGHPIYLKVRDGQTLALTNYDLRVVGTNTPLALLLLNKANDVNGRFSDNSNAVLMPNAPLTGNTSYLFTASGANSGQAITVSFTFTTGPN